MDTLIAMLNDLMWGAVLIYLLIGVGIFFTFRLGFIQIRHFGHMFSVLKNSRNRTTRASPLFRLSVPASPPVSAPATWPVWPSPSIWGGLVPSSGCG